MPGEWPFRAEGGQRVAVQARETAFSGRRWPAGSTLWAGPLLGVSFQAPLTAKSAFFVVRGAARDTPNDGRKKDGRSGAAINGIVLEKVKDSAAGYTAGKDVAAICLRMNIS